MRIIDWSSDVCSSDLSFPDNTAAVPEMLTLERRARAARRGIWADPFYAVRGPEDAGRLVDSFQIVEGRIVEAAEVRRRIYLNFGQDWHRSEEHTSELQSIMRISYAVFCLKKKKETQK